MTTLAAVSREAAEKAIRAKVRPTGAVGGIEPAPPVPKRKPAEPAAAYLRRLERLAADANKAADVPGLQGLLVRILEAYRVYADQEPERSARIVAPHHTARMYELRPDWVPWTSGTLPPLHDQRRWAFNAYMLELTGRGRSRRALPGEALVVSQRVHVIPKPNATPRPNDDPEIAKAIDILRRHLTVKRSRGRAPVEAPSLAEVHEASRLLRKLWRMVFDARDQNDETTRLRGNKLPKYADILARVGGAQFYTTGDVEDGFHSLAIPRDQQWKTAFVGRTPEFPGTWLMTCAQMGGKNVAEVFHNVFSTIVAESPPVVWPLRPVADAEYPAPTIRTEGEVPPAAHPRVLAIMHEAAEFVRQAQAGQVTRRRGAVQRPPSAGKPRGGGL